MVGKYAPYSSIERTFLLINQRINLFLSCPACLSFEMIYRKFVYTNFYDTPLLNRELLISHFRDERKANPMLAF